MRFKTGKILARAPICVCFLALIIGGCGGSYEETVAGVKIPIPNGMTKSQEKAIELSLPGFGGGQASFHGKMDPDKVIEFYKQEMATRGWKPSVGILSRGGMISYSKEGRSVVVTVGKSDGGTSMTITVGGAAR